jgi:hypothetical protein
MADLGLKARSSISQPWPNSAQGPSSGRRTYAAGTRSRQCCQAEEGQGNRSSGLPGQLAENAGRRRRRRRWRWGWRSGSRAPRCVASLRRPCSMPQEPRQRGQQAALRRRRGQCGSQIAHALPRDRLRVLLARPNLEGDGNHSQGQNSVLSLALHYGFQLVLEPAQRLAETTTVACHRRLGRRHRFSDVPFLYPFRLVLCYEALRVLLRDCVRARCSHSGIVVDDG